MCGRWRRSCGFANENKKRSARRRFFSLDAAVGIEYRQDIQVLDVLAVRRTALGQHGVNIATMQLYRSTAGGYAVMVLECDEPIPDEIAGQLGSQPGIVKVTILNL